MIFKTKAETVALNTKTKTALSRPKTNTMTMILKAKAKTVALNTKTKTALSRPKTNTMTMILKPKAKTVALKHQDQYSCCTERGLVMNINLLVANEAQQNLLECQNNNMAVTLILDLVTPKLKMTTADAVLKL